MTATHNNKFCGYRHLQLWFNLWIAVDVFLHDHQKNHTHDGCYECDSICLWQVHEDISVGLERVKMLCSVNSRRNLIYLEQLIHEENQFIWNFLINSVIFLIGRSAEIYKGSRVMEERVPVCKVLRKRECNILTRNVKMLQMNVNSFHAPHPKLGSFSLPFFHTLHH